MGTYNSAVQTISPVGIYVEAEPTATTALLIYTLYAHQRFCFYMPENWRQGSPPLFFSRDILCPSKASHHTGKVVEGNQSVPIAVDVLKNRLRPLLRSQLLNNKNDVFIQHSKDQLTTVFDNDNPLSFVPGSFFVFLIGSFAFLLLSCRKK